MYVHPHKQITKLISALHQMNVTPLYKKHQYHIYSCQNHATSLPAYSHIQIQAMARGVKIFDAHARKCATPTMIIIIILHANGIMTYIYRQLSASSTPLLQICPSSSGGSRSLEIKMKLPFVQRKYMYDPLLAIKIHPSSSKV